MPDISQEAVNYLKNFDKHTKRVYKNQEKAIDTLFDQMEILTRKNKDSFKDFTKQGRLTEEGFEELNKQILQTTKLNKEGKNVFKGLLDQQKNIQQMSDKATTFLENAVDGITSFIPIIGDEISAGFKTK